MDESNIKLIKSELATIDVFIEEKLFTSYHYGIGFAKPVFYPVYTPDGNMLNRAYPMRNDIPGEIHDHWHQESMWFTYGDVNHIDFWSKIGEQHYPGDQEIGESGKIRHTGFNKITSSNKKAELSFNADWIEPNGHIILKQKEDVEFLFDEKSRIMDFTITLSAQDKPVTFFDTKEGMFAIRYNHQLHEENG